MEVSKLLSEIERKIFTVDKISPKIQKVYLNECFIYS